jgi:thymidylate synthase ThyX
MGWAGAECFSEEEQSILRRYFTNLDAPVFALTNLPEVVKGALFARYSRSSKSLRRLFLDEFVGELDISGDTTIDATVGVARAEDLYARVFGEYGDDSVAQLGGVHLACEQASNVLTKVLERGRLMSYLEQSTRYIPYDRRLPNGHYRYIRPHEILDSPMGARYVGDVDRIYDGYGEMVRRLHVWLNANFPRTAEISDFVHRQAVLAKALDGARGLLPAAALSNVGIYGDGQSYEALLLRMRVHPLAEVRLYADLMLEELRKVIPSFLVRVDRAERGGEWSRYFAEQRDGTTETLNRLFGDDGDEVQDVTPSSVRLIDYDPEGELKVLAAIVSTYRPISETDALSWVRSLDDSQRAEIFTSYVGNRKNRRHRPGRAFERTDYRFEVVSDYGAFRDLQRHRILSIEWQSLNPTLGFDVPDLVADAGESNLYREVMERSGALFHDLVATHKDEAVYAVALGYRIRYVMQMNAREAMHVCELRSGTQGHPAYRTVAQEMHKAIGEVAKHRHIAASMSHMDYSIPLFERLEAEKRAESRRQGREPHSGATPASTATP